MLCVVDGAPGDGARSVTSDLDDQTCDDRGLVATFERSRAVRHEIGFGAVV
jgi:hypothetical protein